MDAPLSEVKASSAQAQLSKRAMVEKEIFDRLEALKSLEAVVIEMKQTLPALNTKLNSTAPFNMRLPHEVISEIFDLVNESQDKNNFRALPAPFLLGRICKAWRLHVESRPRIWSAITICLSPKRYPIQEQLVQQWLIRSGDYDLHYNISFCARWEPPCSFAQLILQSSSRWKSFKTVSIPSLPIEINKCTHFPRLSSAHIITRKAPSSEEYNFMSAKELKHLELPNGLPGSLSIRWKKIFSFAASLDSDMMLKITERITNVQKLQLKLLPSEDSVIPEFLPQVLHYLTHLEIGGDERGISVYLNSITTPALTTLKVSSARSHDVNWTNCLAELHKRSPLGLTTLSLHNLNLTDTVYVEMLGLFPNISTLFLENVGFSLSDLIIENLKPNLTAPNNHFLPNLTDFTYKGNAKFHLQKMVEMLEQRIVSSQDQSQAVRIQPLRSVTIKYRNPVWYRKEDPNQMHEIYRKIINLESRGTLLSLIYEAD